MKEKLFTFILFLFVATNIAHGFQYGDLYYDCTSDSTVAVVSHKEFVGLSSVCIPSSVTYNGKDYSVTKIDANAFYYCANLASITIPNSVISIGARAFEGCSSLTEITIPNSVIIIGNYTFRGCRGLKSLTIPKSVIRIGYQIIAWCSNIQSISVEQGNPKYDSRDNCNAIIETSTNALIAGCQNTIISNTINIIGPAAFYYCEGLRNVVLPKSVKSIETEAFEGCSSLATISIPNGVKNIGSSAFASCLVLDSVTIPGSVIELGGGIFSGDSSLSSVVIGRGVKSVQGYMFMGCPNLRTVALPISITQIANNAFDGCSGLSTITIPQYVTSVEISAFCDCSALTSVTCYAIEPPEIHDYAFYGVPTIPLYVPAESVEKYKQADCWKDFIVLPLSAKQIAVDEPILNPSDNYVEIIWPQDPSATTYTIDISKGSNLFCLLIFDANGVLQNIRFGAPARSQESATPQVANNGFNFVVDGLESGTTYHYTINAKNSAGHILKAYSGTFKTTGADIGVELPAKFIRNGLLMIHQGGKYYTATGAEFE